MNDRPQAKLVRHIPSGKREPWWDRWEYECVECGTHYIRSANTSRINPYCGECTRKRDREKQKERMLQKQMEHDAEVRREAISEILMPYDVESIEELIINSYNRGRADALEKLDEKICDMDYEEYRALIETSIPRDPRHLNIPYLMFEKFKWCAMEKLKEK